MDSWSWGVVSSEDEPWLRERVDGVVLAVHVVPGASRAGIAGRHGDALRIRVTAPPSGGAANRKLVQVVAETLGVRVAAVSIARGAAARQKLVHVHGVGMDLARSRLGGLASVDSVRGRH